MPFKRIPAKNSPPFHWNSTPVMWVINSVKKCHLGACADIDLHKCQMRKSNTLTFAQQI